MGYDPAIHEAAPAPVARRYVDDYLPPMAARRRDLGLKRWKTERAQGEQRRKAAAHAAREQIDRWVQEGRDVRAILADMLLIVWRVQYGEKGIPDSELQQLLRAGGPASAIAPGGATLAPADDEPRRGSRRIRAVLGPEAKR